MIQRCTNPLVEKYSAYGGRGIRVCDRWRSFENFLSDMGDRPGAGYSIDRINNDSDYEPGNCRWATLSEQRRNTRRSVHITIDGTTRILDDWLKIYNVDSGTYYYRLKKGLSPEEALTLPTRWRKTTTAHGPEVP